MIQYYQNPYLTQPQVALVQQPLPAGQNVDITGWPVTAPTGVGQLPFFETSYIENILRLNLGKLATVYMNFENSQWGSKIFKGVIEAAGKDHIILSDPVTGMRYLLLTIFLNYITFDEEIEYEYPLADILAGLQQQPTQQFQQPVQPFQQPTQQTTQPQFQQAPQPQYQNPQPFQQRVKESNNNKKSAK